MPHGLRLWDKEEVSYARCGDQPGLKSAISRNAVSVSPRAELQTAANCANGWVFGRHFRGKLQRFGPVRRQSGKERLFRGPSQGGSSDRADGCRILRRLSLAKLPVIDQTPAKGPFEVGIAR